MNDIPVLYTHKEDCCGCAACYAVCPRNAIAMVEDDEGFEYPRIRETDCIGCRMCMKVCPIKTAEKAPLGQRLRLGLRRWIQLNR